MEWKFSRENLVVVTYLMQVENFVVTYFMHVEIFLCLNLILRFTAYSWSRVEADYSFSLSTPSLSLGDQSRALRKVLLEETELNGW